MTTPDTIFPRTDGPTVPMVSVGRTTRPRKLFDSTWRSSCPIRPRHSVARRTARYVAILFLALLIGAYAYVTDDARLGRLAAGFVGELVGAEVEVREVSFRLFEGIELADVRLLVPEPDPDSEAPALSEEDRLVLTARAIFIEYADYNILRFLAGNFSGARVTALDPHIRLVENTDTGVLNIQQLGIVAGREPDEGQEDEERATIKPPAVILRNARVDVMRREADVLETAASLGLEAQLNPFRQRRRQDDAVTYNLNLDLDFAKRGDTPTPEEDEGPNKPNANGSLTLGGRDRAVAFDARLSGVEFDRVANMLPTRVGSWAKEHGVSGQMQVPELSFNFVPSQSDEDEATMTFRARAELNRGRALLRPDIWLDNGEILAREAAAAALESLALNPDLPPALRADVSRWSQTWRPEPIPLRDARGYVVFDESGIAEADFSGEIGGNRLEIRGEASGYGRDAGVQLTVRTPDGEPFDMADAAPFISSLPRPIREAFHRFRPMGRAKLEMRVDREEGGRPVLFVETDFFDGSFELEALPYRVYDATGRILVRPIADSDDVRHELVIEDLVAFGNPLTVNRDATVRANGLIGPLERSPGFRFDVQATNVEFERALLAALPTEAQEGIAVMDPSWHEAVPGLPRLDFAGDVDVLVVRPPGVDKRWNFRAEIDAARFSGALEAFPYPLVQANGNLTITQDGLTLHRSRIERPGGGHVGAAGEVLWNDTARDGLEYDFAISGRQVDIDDDLLEALPLAASETIGELGIGGRGDVTATVKGTAESDVDYDVTLDLHAGRIWPAGFTFYLEDVQGEARVLPEQVVLAGVAGRRDNTRIGVDGTIGLAEDGPLFFSSLTIVADGLPLDTGLYDLLPLTARDAWDWLRPTIGTIDANGSMRFPTILLTADDEDEEVDPALFDDIDINIDLALHDVAATPLGFPYPLGGINGSLNVTTDTIELHRLTAGRLDLDGPSFDVTGVGDLTVESSPSGIWTLDVEAAGIPVDAALVAAVPEGVAELFETLLFTGTLGADVPNLKIITKVDEEVESDADIDGRIFVKDASFDIGVPVSGFNGHVDLDIVRRLESMQELTADVTGQSFQAFGRPGSGLALNAWLDKPAETLHFDNINADLSGGLLESSATMDWFEDEERDTSYEARVRVEGVAFEQLTGAEFGGGFGDGIVAAELRMQGIQGRPETRRGRGSLRVTGERLYSLPVVVNVIRVGNLLLPSELDISRIQAEFHDDGGRVTIDDLAVWLASDLVGTNPGPESFSGRGVVDVNEGQWRLEIGPGPGGWERVPVFGNFARFTRNELLVTTFADKFDIEDSDDEVLTIRPTVDGETVR